MPSPTSARSPAGENASRGGRLIWRLRAWLLSPAGDRFVIAGADLSAALLIVFLTTASTLALQLGLGVERLSMMFLAGVLVAAVQRELARQSCSPRSCRFRPTRSIDDAFFPGSDAGFCRRRHPVKVLVTGSSSCLARALLPRLCAGGDITQVTGVDLRAAHFAHLKFRALVMDFRDPQTTALLPEHDALVHLAYVVLRGRMCSRQCAPSISPAA